MGRFGGNFQRFFNNGGKQAKNRDKKRLKSMIYHPCQATYVYKNWAFNGNLQQPKMRLLLQENHCDERVKKLKSMEYRINSILNY